MGRLSSPPRRIGFAPRSLASAPEVVRSQHSRDHAPWRRWYSLARWRALRMQTFRRDRFTCQWPGCGKVQGDTALLVCDHRRRHGGSEALFWDPDNLQTLCKSPCHDMHKQRMEAADRRVGPGWD